MGLRLEVENGSLSTCGPIFEKSCKTSTWPTAPIE